MIQRLCAVIILIVFGSTPCTGDSNIVSNLLESRSLGKPTTLPSSKIADLQVDKAYEIQKSLVESILKNGDRIIGFKAALMNDELLRKFDLQRPVIAPLFASGKNDPDAVLHLDSFVNPFIEQEIGFIIKDKIDQPITEMLLLRTKVREICPVVEIPDLRYSKDEEIKGVDIIADAASSAKFIIGTPVRTAQVKPEQVEVKLLLNEHVVNEGRSSAIFGDEWFGLMWLVNAILAQGYTIEPGSILITGVMGEMLPAQVGKYQGSWGPLGEINWTFE